MARSVLEVIALLSQKSSLMLFTQYASNPGMVNNVLERVMGAVDDWEKEGVMLDPVAFEAVTDVLVKQFSASYLASEALIRRCKCDAFKDVQ